MLKDIAQKIRESKTFNLDLGIEVPSSEEASIKEGLNGEAEPLIVLKKYKQDNEHLALAFEEVEIDIIDDIIEDIILTKPFLMDIDNERVEVKISPSDVDKALKEYGKRFYKKNKEVYSGVLYSEEI